MQTKHPAPLASPPIAQVRENHRLWHEEGIKAQHGLRALIVDAQAQRVVSLRKDAEEYPPIACLAEAARAYWGRIYLAVLDSARKYGFEQSFLYVPNEEGWPVLAEAGEDEKG